MTDPFCQNLTRTYGIGCEAGVIRVNGALLRQEGSQSLLDCQDDQK
jgi:hypothetical protein